MIPGDGPAGASSLSMAWGRGYYGAPVGVDKLHEAYIWMIIDKTFIVAAPQGQVWEFITSPDKVAACVPGCLGAEEIEPDRYKAEIKTKVGPIKTTFKVDIETIEKRPPEFASYQSKGEEGSKASRIKATSSLNLKAIDAGHTEVTYSSDIAIMGRLGKFGSGMMKKVADSIGDEFVAEMLAQLEPEGETRPIEPADGGHRRLWIAAGIASALLIGLLAFYALR